MSASQGATLADAVSTELQAGRAVLVDAHTHLPMHLRPRGGDGIRAAASSRAGRYRLLERERGGAIGLIFGERLTRSGPRASAPGSIGESVDLLCRHLDKLAELTGSFRHLAIGSDLGGFIKPLAGLEDASRLAALREPLRERYGEENARAVLGGNVLALLRCYWGRREAVGA